MSQATSTAGKSLGLVAQVGLLAGPFLTMVDSSVVNVAVSDISRDLHTPLSSTQWVLSVYLLALAVVLAATAYLPKRFGTHRVYLISLMGFTATSALCAASPNLQVLIAARVLQGALGAPLVPLAMGMLLGEEGASKEMPPVAGMLLFLAPAIGPTLGGILIPLAGWQSIFLINVPLGIVALYSVWHMPRGWGQLPDSSVRFDFVGFLLVATGLGLAIYGASEGPQRGWTASSVWPYWAVGLALILVYVAWALRHSHPAINIKLLFRPQAALAIVLSVLTSIVLFVAIFLIPVFVQQIQGHSALVAGLAMLPQGIVTGIATVFGDRLAIQRGVRFATVTGMLVLIAGTAALLRVDEFTPVWVIAAILCARGLALGLVIQPLLNIILGGLSQSEVADGNTLFNVAERLGGSFGISLIATYFAIRERLHIESTLHNLGIGSKTLGTVGSSLPDTQLPPVVRDKLAQAAVAGFHDVVWVLIGVSALGLAATVFIGKQSENVESESAHAMT